MTAESERIEMRGMGVSPGFGIGHAVFLGCHTIIVPTNCVDDTENEKWILRNAYGAVIRETKDLYEMTLQTAGEEGAEIFDLHLSLLADPEFMNPILEEIDIRKYNAALAVDKALLELAEVFHAMEDKYMSERAADILDIKKRLIGKILHGDEESHGRELCRPSVIVADDLNPSDTALLNLEYVRGIVTRRGGATSHAAILSRMLSIPAVLGIGEDIKRIPEGCEVLLNGGTGSVVVHPNTADRELAERGREERKKLAKELARYRDLPTMTKDGHPVHLCANIGTPEDVARVVENGAEGIGLFRSEFLFLNRETSPSEEEQFMAYRTVLEAMKGKPVIIRTLDIGGDKAVPYLNLPKEDNPFLGYRAIRLCLGRRDLFLTQIKALLRAGTAGNLRIMFPMISSLEELRQAKELVEEAKDELRKGSVPFVGDIQLGIMIEIPAAALSAPLLAKECDFFSIGTNDLTQYTLAVDRGNGDVADLYTPYHPAVLALIRMTVRAARNEGIPCGICGEAAGDRTLMPLFIGFGMNELSMNAGSILEVRREISGLTFPEAVKLTDIVSTMSTAVEIRTYLQQRRKETEIDTTI